MHRSLLQFRIRAVAHPTPAGNRLGNGVPAGFAVGAGQDDLRGFGHVGQAAAALCRHALQCWVVAGDGGALPFTNSDDHLHRYTADDEPSAKPALTAQIVPP